MMKAENFSKALKATNNLGDDCDVRQWEDLLAILEKEYEQRKGK